MNKAFEAILIEDEDGDTYLGIYSLVCKHTSSGEWIGAIEESHGSLSMCLPGWGFTPAELRELADLVEQCLEERKEKDERA